MQLTPDQKKKYYDDHINQVYEQRHGFKDDLKLRELSDQAKEEFRSQGGNPDDESTRFLWSQKVDDSMSLHKQNQLDAIKNEIYNKNIEEIPSYRSDLVSQRGINGKKLEDVLHEAGISGIEQAFNKNSNLLSKPDGYSRSDSDAGKFINKLDLHYKNAIHDKLNELNLDHSKHVNTVGDLTSKARQKLEPLSDTLRGQNFDTSHLEHIKTRLSPNALQSQKPEAQQTQVISAADRFKKSFPLLLQKSEKFKKTGLKKDYLDLYAVVENTLKEIKSMPDNKLIKSGRKLKKQNQPKLLKSKTIDKQDSVGKIEAAIIANNIIEYLSYEYSAKK